MSNTYHMIAAVERTGGIGKDGKMPWPNLPDDMRRFKSLTMGCDVIMGRKTYDELRKLAGKGGAYEILPGRHITVLSKRAPEEVVPENVELIRAPEHFEPKAPGRPAWVIGGAQIYERYVTACSKLYLTHVLRGYACDVFFPLMNVALWEQIETLRVPETDTTPAYRFAVYERP